MELFRNLDRSVDIEILNICDARNWTTKVQNCVDALKRNVQSHLKQDITFYFAYIGKDIHPDGVWQFHDRFLIIDDQEFYLIGSSMSYHRISDCSTGIYHVEHDEDKRVIKDAYEATKQIAANDNTYIFLNNLL